MGKHTGDVWARHSDTKKSLLLSVYLSQSLTYLTPQASHTRPKPSDFPRIPAKRKMAKRQGTHRRIVRETGISGTGKVCVTGSRADCCPAGAPNEAKTIAFEKTCPILATCPKPTNPQEAIPPNNWYSSLGLTTSKRDVGEFLVRRLAPLGVRSARADRGGQHTQTLARSRNGEMNTQECISVWCELRGLRAGIRQTIAR
jgi:hypothetical protein